MSSVRQDVCLLSVQGKTAETKMNHEHTSKTDNVQDKLDDILKHNGEIHMSNKNENERNIVDHHLKCDKCSYIAIHTNDLRRHKNVMHEVPLTCNKCEKEFRHIESLRIHIREDHRPSRTFYSRNLVKNVSRPSEISPMRLSKPVLSSTNNDASLNKEPVVTNTSTATYSTDFIRECPFKCAHVPKTFTHKDEFQIHIDFYHDEKIAPSQ